MIDPSQRGEDEKPTLPDESSLGPGLSPTRTLFGGVERLAPGALLAGRYRILELVGVGGMGVVYRARDEELDLAVAVKVLRPEMAAQRQLVERFRKELVLARQVTHRNAVRIHDIGQDGDVVFLTMDFVPGRSLREVLEREGPLPPEQAAEIARQIACALEAAHDEGVVHRDLKPANVLLDGTGRAYLTDFGVARSLHGAGLTRPGAVVGTLDYLSPEQARGEEVDGRSDLYSLGLLLFEMLTGALPFSGGSDTEVLAQRLTGVPRDLGKMGIKVPLYLCAVARRLLARDPARRYRSARELIDDLERRRAPGLRARALPAAAAAILALAALAWLVLERGWVTLPSARPAAGPRHAVAVLPLADQTGRPDLAWTSAGLAEMLAAALAESPGLRVVDTLRVLRTLEDLSLPRGPLGKAEMRRLAELLEADRLVAGTVRSAGGRLRVDLELVSADLPSLEAAPLHAEAASMDEVFELIAELGATLRGRLEVAPSRAEAAPVSTSPAALAAYAEGVEHLLRRDALAAAPALEKAAELDPAFTAAWVRLARARESLGRHEEALEAARRAEETLGESSSRIAYEARALAARFSGEPEKAQAILAELVDNYPNDAEARVDLGEAYGEQGSLEKAIAVLQQAVELDPMHPRGWFLLGKYAIGAGDSRGAVDKYLVHARVVQNKLGSDQGQADVLNALGVAYQELGDLARAAENYEQAAEIRARIGDDRGYATSLRNLASIHIVRGEFPAAAEQLGKARSLLEGIGDQAGLADVHNAFGVLTEEQGLYEETLEHYRRALSLRQDLGDGLALAESLNNVGYAYYLLGQFDHAMVYWSKGLDLRRANGDPVGVTLATQSIGLLQLAQGDWDPAVKSFHEALETSREMEMKDAAAVSLGHIGRVAQFRGRLRAALASFGQALDVLRELDDPRGLAEFTLAEAEVALELGMLEPAQEHLEEARRLLEGSSNHEQQSELLRLTGEWRLRRGELAPAAEALRGAVAEAEASHGVVALLQARLSAAGVELARGRRREALAALARLSEEARSLGHALLELRASEALAQAALAAGDAGLAEETASSGLRRAQKCGAWAGAYRLHLLLAKALAAQGKAAEAAAALERAAAEVARLREDLTAEQRQAFDRLPEVLEIGERVEALDRARGRAA